MEGPLKPNTTRWGRWRRRSTRSAASHTTTTTRGATSSAPFTLMKRRPARRTTTWAASRGRRDDEGYGDSADPQTLHKYVYTPGNPISYDDLNGHDFGFENVWAMNVALGLDRSGAVVSLLAAEDAGLKPEDYQFYDI